MRASVRASASRSEPWPGSQHRWARSRSLRPPKSKPPAPPSRRIWARRDAMRNRFVALFAIALIAACSLASSAGARRQADPLTIYAAASLTEVFSSFDRAQRYNFAGSNALETQIRNGAPADVFASAAPLSTQRLFQARMVEKPVTFTSNRLVVIVPRSNPAGIHSVYDLKRKPVKLVIAGAAVPVGGYTRTVLRKMGLTSVLSKVVSQEADAKGVTRKIGARA